MIVFSMSIKYVDLAAADSLYSVVGYRTAQVLGNSHIQRIRSSIVRIFQCAKFYKSMEGVSTCVNGQSLDGLI